MDECNIDEIEIRRRPSRRQPYQSLFARMSSTTMSDKKSTRCSPSRAHSLNVRATKVPVTRNISSPSTMQHPISGGNQRYCNPVFSRFSFIYIVKHTIFSHKKIIIDIQDLDCKWRGNKSPICQQ